MRRLSSSVCLKNATTISHEEFLKTIDCYVMGSRTYETALAFEAKGFGWAYGDTTPVGWWLSLCAHLRRTRGVPPARHPVASRCSFPARITVGRYGRPTVRVKGRTHPRKIETVRDPDFLPESCGHRARMEGRCLCL